MSNAGRSGMRLPELASAAAVGASDGLGDVTAKSVEAGVAVEVGVAIVENEAGGEIDLRELSVLDDLETRLKDIDDAPNENNDVANVGADDMAVEDNGVSPSVGEVNDEENSSVGVTVRTIVAVVDPLYTQPEPSGIDGP
jgi:hypothetical protein